MGSRRDFLRACCSAGAVGVAMHLSRFGLITAFAQSGTAYKALVCIYLAGGNDCNNTIIPLDPQGYLDYSTSRAVLALPANSLLPLNAAGGVPAFGLHPRLSGLQNLYNQKKVALVFNVGTLVQPTSRNLYIAGQSVLPHALYSHADQSNQWQTTITNPTAGGGLGTGWGARVMNAVQNLNPNAFPPAISVAGSSLFLGGTTADPLTVTPGSSFGLNSFGSTGGDQARRMAMQQILTFDTGLSLIGSASAIMQSSISSAQQLNSVLAGLPPLRTVFPAGTLGSQLQQVATLIQVRGALGMNRQIFFCNLGGFDTHTGLLNTQDALFASLDPALSAFYSATQELYVDQDVTTFTESEFNRTLQPSSGDGCDHAWGGHHFVMGSAVNGGTTYGMFPTLELSGPDDADYRGIWVPTLSLDQYAATLAAWFGVPANSLSTIFPNLPNFTPQTLGFV